MLLKITLITLICVGIQAATLPLAKPYYDLDNAEELFEEFLETYEKSYKDEEEFQMRFNIFVENLKKINEFNLMHENTVFAINFLHDLTPEELKDFMGTRVPTVLPDTPIYEPLNFTAPDSLDWRAQNKVTPIRNQGQCGSCWAFSAVAVLESQAAIKKNQLLDMAEQQLVDCDTDSFGCNGGWPVKAFESAAKEGGIMAESSYPYQARQGRCAFSANGVALKVTGGHYLSGITEEQLTTHVASYGPVSIAMNMSPQLSSYSGGVISPTDCGGQVNHALAIVGYGTDGGTPFWVIKNSWGTIWGEQGYMRLARGQNLCMITSYVSVADVA